MIPQPQSRVSLLELFASLVYLLVAAGLFFGFFGFYWVESPVRTVRGGLTGYELARPILESQISSAINAVLDTGDMRALQRIFNDLTSLQVASAVGVFSLPLMSLTYLIGAIATFISAFLNRWHGGSIFLGIVRLILLLVFSLALPLAALILFHNEILQRLTISLGTGFWLSGIAVVVGCVMAVIVVINNMFWRPGLKMPYGQPYYLPGYPQQSGYYPPQGVYPPPQQPPQGPWGNPPRRF